MAGPPGRGVGRVRGNRLGLDRRIEPEDEHLVFVDAAAFVREAPHDRRTAGGEFEALSGRECRTGDVGQPGYYGSAFLEPLDSGSPVLVTTTPDGSISIAEWVQGGVDIAVLGPALQSDQAKTIAKAISAA